MAKRKTKTTKPVSETQKALNKLIDIRHQKGVSLTEVVKLTGMTASRLRKLEEGNGDIITFKMLERYARAIDIKLVIQLRREEA